MNKPIIADNKPIKVALKKDVNYVFCTCGHSKTQPFCDGAHAGTGFRPHFFKAEETADAYLCACKNTSNTPFCDGTHKKFTDDQVGES